MTSERPSTSCWSACSTRRATSSGGRGPTPEHLKHGGRRRPYETQRDRDRPAARRHLPHADDRARRLRHRTAPAACSRWSRARSWSGPARSAPATGRPRRASGLRRLPVHRDHHARGRRPTAGRSTARSRCTGTQADRETHAKMGFHEGWGTCADQLERGSPRELARMRKADRRRRSSASTASCRRRAGPRRIRPAASLHGGWTLPYWDEVDGRGDGRELRQALRPAARAAGPTRFSPRTGPITEERDRAARSTPSPNMSPPRRPSRSPGRTASGWRATCRRRSRG